MADACVIRWVLQGVHAVHASMASVWGHMASDTLQPWALASMQSQVAERTTAIPCSSALSS